MVVAIDTALGQGLLCRQDRCATGKATPKRASINATSVLLAAKQSLPLEVSVEPLIV